MDIFKYAKGHKGKFVLLALMMALISISDVLNSF